MNKVKVLGVNVNDYGGDGTPLMFLHSFPLSSEMWNKQVEYFKKKHRVITYDIRGLGESGTDDNVYSMEKMVNDFFHILNNLKIQKVHAVGLSMGGYILLRAVLKDSERLNSVTLVNTKADKDDDEVILKRSSAVIKIKSGGREAYLKKLMPYLTNSNLNNIDEIVRQIISKNSDEGICGNLLALSTRTNTTNQIKNINLPVLLISGIEDLINSFTEMDKLYDIMKQNMSKDTLTSYYKIKNCGHLCNMENALEFNKILEWFLNSIEFKS